MVFFLSKLSLNDVDVMDWSAARSRQARHLAVIAAFDVASLNDASG